MSGRIDKTLSCADPPDGCVLVPIGHGLAAIIDADDAEMVLEHQWCAHDNGYAVSRINDRIIRLHRFILAYEGHGDVDHINGIKLDCRRTNLRIVSRSQNCMNSRKRNTSKYKGVYWDKTSGKWVARAHANKVCYEGGRHDTAEMAAVAYDVIARRIHGDFARLNFPSIGERAASDRVEEMQHSVDEGHLLGAGWVD